MVCVFFKGALLATYYGQCFIAMLLLLAIMSASLLPVTLEYCSVDALCDSSSSLGKPVCSSILLFCQFRSVPSDHSGFFLPAP